MCQMLLESSESIFLLIFDCFLCSSASGIFIIKFIIMEQFELKSYNVRWVKPGMFWYEDDVVSTKLDPGKRLKSVVLFTEGQVVYGDSFMVRFGNRRNADVYSQEMLAFLADRGIVSVAPTSDELHKVFINKALINASLRVAKKLPWSEDCFWVRSFVARIVNLYDWDVRNVSPDFMAFIRPIIIHRL